MNNSYLSEGALANFGLFFIFRDLFTEGEVKLLYVLVPSTVYGYKFALQVSCVDDRPDSHKLTKLTACLR